VTVEGARQTLSPILQVEAYRIARELLRNAFLHARARKIEAEIRYEDRLFRLRIRDDGKGIDPKVLQATAGAPDTGGCPESGSVRSKSAHAIGISGAKPERVRKLN
jgi:signal transduction histidine kinase